MVIWFFLSRQGRFLFTNIAISDGNITFFELLHFGEDLFLRGRVSDKAAQKRELFWQCGQKDVVLKYEKNDFVGSRRDADRYAG